MDGHERHGRATARETANDRQVGAAGSTADRTPMKHTRGARLVLAMGVVLAAITIVPALSPVGTASAVQCADDETAVEISLQNDDLGTEPPNDIYYTIIKNGGAYDGIVENDGGEELESSPYLIKDLKDSTAEWKHTLTACYTEGLQHDVQLENQDGSETDFYDGIEDELFFLVEGGVRDGTVEKEYIDTNHIEVQFQTELSCSRDERKVEMEFGGGGEGGTYTAFVDGDEISVEDNDLEAGTTETREMCFEYGNTYTVEQKGDHTDDGTLPDPEIEDVKYLDSDGDYVYLGSNDDVSDTNPNARVEFTVNRAPTANATIEENTTTIVERNTSLTFNATDSSDPDGNSLSYEWDFGDGTTETGATVTHNYSDAVSTRGGSETFSPDLTVDDGLDRNNTDTDSDFETITVYNDMDGDGRADSDDAPGPADPDDDGDGIPDSVEQNHSANTTDLPAGATKVTVDGTEYPDSDGDGNADLWDRDSDGDGIPDSVEGDNDTDGDGTADYRDVDSDNDGIPDAEEGTTDGDGDGVPAYRDASPRFTGGANLSTIDEDPTSNDGTNVSGLLGDVFDDTDGGEDSLAGIAITADGATADEGTWQYSTDSGTTWHAVESVSSDEALLLDAAAKLRFAPAKNYNGNPGNLTVFAVDDGDDTNFTDGTTRREFDTTADDALSPVSPSGVGVGITVESVNDAPTMSTDTRSLDDIDEDETGNDGTAVATILDSNGTTDDIEGDTLGVAITGVDDTNGTWEYSTDGGSSWSAVSSASPTDSSALLLSDDALVRFVPTGDFSGSAAGSITFRAWDQTSGAAGDTGVDTTTNGGTTAYSNNTAQASITVLDAPEVSSITPNSPQNLTNADTVDFNVTFTESVTGIETDDFTVTQVSGDVTGSVAGVESGSGTTITVTVDSVTGDGDLRLDLNDDDSITSDSNGVVLGGTGTSGTANGSYSSGETFTIDNTAPSADASNSDTAGDEDTAINFDANASSDGETSIVSYEWDWTDDGTYEDSGQTASHTYPDPGTDTVRLQVTDGAGNTDTDTITVTVNDVTDPTADAGSDQTVDEDTAISFDASGATDNGNIASYDWDFDDGDTATGETPTHTYADPGTYTVTLTVEDAAGNQDSDTLTVTVNDVTDPVADARSDHTVDEDTAASFDASGSTDNGDITSYEWDFGDGQTATGKTPTHTYADSGTYTVTLTVTDAAGNTDTDTVTVTIESADESGSDPDPDPEPEPDPDESTDQQNETSDPAEPTVWDNETTIRQQVTVPTNATVTRAEQVSLPGNTSEPVRATFTQNASVSSIQFPAGTNGTVTVVEFDQQHPAYDDTPGQVVHQFQITASPDAENATATVRTRIAESELQTADINQSDVRIAHHTNGSWQVLNTTVADRTNGTLVLEAMTDGLSPFAITAVDTPDAVPSVESTSVTTGEELTLDASNSTTPYGEIVSYEWSVSEQTLSGETATLTPEAAGEHTIELTVTNDAGRTATATTTVVVENETGSEPTPDGTPDNSTQTDPSTPPTNDTATQPETTSGSSGPGFGLIVALVALAGIALLAIRKRQ